METLDGVTHYGGSLASSVADWTLNNPAVIFFTATFLLFLCFAWGFLAWYNKDKKDRPEDREARLRRVIKLMADRKAKLDMMYADMIGDMLFALWCNGAISRQEYRRDSRRFGVKYKLHDLLPRNNRPEAIKARVHKNIDLIRADRKALQEKLKDGGFAVFEAKIRAMPDPGHGVVQRKLYVVRGKRLGLRS